MIYTCWYCKHAFREDETTVVCNCQLLSRSHAVCGQFIPDRMKYEHPEQLRI